MSKFHLLVAVLLLSPSLLPAQEEPRPEKALCLVCALKDGETEFEKVKAHSDHAGQTYYFCSTDCKEEFDLDPTGYLPPKLPRPAPAMVVETLTGDSVALQDFKGKWVLLDFWATWCKPCLKMMPKLQQLNDSYTDKGLMVLGVSVDDDKNRIKKIEKFVDKVGISYPIFSDAKENPAWYVFKVKVLPTLFLIDPSSQIVAQWTGEIDHEQIRAEVAARMVPHP
ncbi:MAG: redoxin domain-containing protein [Candidatus Latescibacteria bacterium]|nr:redoxin domain-containing protein [Candidatus Latescibacterota bacterium]